MLVILREIYILTIDTSNGADLAPKKVQYGFDKRSNLVSYLWARARLWNNPAETGPEGGGDSSVCLLI